MWKIKAILKSLFTRSHHVDITEQQIQNLPWAFPWEHEGEKHRDFTLTKDEMLLLSHLTAVEFKEYIRTHKQ